MRTAALHLAKASDDKKRRRTCGEGGNVNGCFGSAIHFFPSRVGSVQAETTTAAAYPPMTEGETAFVQKSPTQSS